MKITPALLSTAFVIALSGCGSNPVAPKPVPPTANCPVQAPKDINFWINVMPGPGNSAGKPLIGTFTVTAPTPGYTFSANVERVMESHPIQAVLNLTATPPSGMVTQVITETSVNIRIPNFPGAEGSRVSVYCAGKPFIPAQNVSVAH